MVKNKTVRKLSRRWSKKKDRRPARFQSGDHHSETAIQCPQTSQENAKQKGDELQVAQAHLRLAEEYKSKNDVRDAIQLYQDSLAIARKHGYKDVEEHAIRELSKLTDTEDLNHLTEQTASPSRVPDNAAAGLTDQNTISTERNQKSSRIADEDCEAVVKISQSQNIQPENGDNVDRSNFKNKTGLIDHSTESKEELQSSPSYPNHGKDAIKRNKKATQVIVETKDCKSDKFVSDEQEEELQFQKKMKEIAIQDEVKLDECLANQAIGNIYWNAGNFEEAKIYYQDALKNAMELGDKHCEGTAYLGLASAFSQEFNYEMAQKWYDRAFHIFETEPNHYVLKERALVGLGIAWFNLGNLQKATESIQRAQKLASENDKDNAAAGLTDQSKISTERNQKSSQIAEIPNTRQWMERSIIHHEKLVKILEYAKIHPEKIRDINGVRVCCSEEFLIGEGSDGSLVYVGLGKDGVEKAVKRLPRDACSSLPEQEKKVLSQLNTKKSQHIVNYWFLEDQSDKDFLFLILDLCEESLENFVKRSSVTDLVRCAPDIIKQVLNGLADLHRDPNHVLHRDLKPSNILRNVQGHWLVTDFGITRILKAGVRPYVSTSRETENWKAVESCFVEGKTSDKTILYKKESDIQVAGMVAFHILTKGEHPFGEKPDRLQNLLDGKPVSLKKLKDDATKDLISWMLSHNPKDRPAAEEALKHPYLQPAKQKFELLCKVGNQPEIKTRDVKSDVVRKLNSNLDDWQNEMAPDVLRYLSTDCLKGKTFSYRSYWTDCLRLIRNVDQHWKDRPRPRPEVFYTVDNPQKYFLDLFPSLCVEVHKIVRSCDWKERDYLKEYFV